MKRLILRFAVAAAAAVTVVAAAAPLASATARSGTLQVNKECSHYDGNPGSYCTFYPRTSMWAPVGTNILYLQPESNSSDAILDPPGPGNNKALRPLQPP